jgi:hypothetical protein
MKNVLVFFIIGTVGMLVIAILQMGMATAFHVAFFALFPMFISFLAIGSKGLSKQRSA